MTSKSYSVPPELLLGAHLSASRYLMVCALTIAAWDTLVLSERTWNITKTREQLPLKIVLLILRYLIPVEYIVLGIIHFDPSIQPSTCNHLTLLEPILTTSLLLLSSFALILILTSTPSAPSSASETQGAANINTHSARYSVTTTLTSTRSLLSHFKSPTHRALWFLLLVQLVLHAIGTAFFQSIDVGSGKGCISGPSKSHGASAGVYYLGATFVYFVSFGWTLRRSVKDWTGSMSVWNTFVTDSLGLHMTIAIVNFVNLIIVFVIEPRDNADPIRSIVSPLSTILTATSTIRIILSRIGRDGTLNHYSKSGSGAARVSIQGNEINTNMNNQTIGRDVAATIPISIATPLPTSAAKVRVRTPPLSRYLHLHDHQQYGLAPDSLTLPTPPRTTHVVSLDG